MNEQEFKTLTNRLFAAFPHIWDWLNSKSPDTKVTLATWLETLSDCRLDESLLVIDEWIRGKRQPPTPYECHMTALVIRARVHFERDREAKRTNSNARLETYEDHKREAERRRLGYTPMLTDADRESLATIAAEGITAKEQWVSRRLGREPAREEIHALSTEFSKSPEMAKILERVK